ncbi:hypothetical protein J2X57_002770 [Luteibacter sp. 1214]|uniref:hypothetical protein n=1 Tax=Luteibacter sp. 1214 TaxID=2817735 RepID=UPI00285EE69A|nr:hypothetical protein [Luteibacter sp. 1214]MDR6643549.1 hypothetical protein [Luteibacter sp. 1214]
MKQRVSAVVLVMALVCASPAASAREYVLSLKGVDVRPGERIVGLEMHGKHLTLASVVHVPNGWSFKVDTDPAGNMDLSGAVIVGAAALSPADVEQAWLFRDAAGAVNEPAALTGTITVTKTFDDSREIPLKTDMLVAKTARSGVALTNNAAR